MKRENRREKTYQCQKEKRRRQNKSEKTCTSHKPSLSFTVNVFYMEATHIYLPTWYHVYIHTCITCTAHLRPIVWNHKHVTWYGVLVH